MATVLSELLRSASVQHGVAPPGFDAVTRADEDVKHKPVKREGRRRYGAEELAEAVRFVAAQKGKNEALPIASVAEVHGVPDSTLRDHIHAGGTVGPVGRPTWLHAQDELWLVIWLTRHASANMPVWQHELRVRAAVLAATRGRPFEGKSRNCASRRWLTGFLQRHPELVIQMSKDSKKNLPTQEMYNHYYSLFRVVPFLPRLVFSLKRKKSCLI